MKVTKESNFISKARKFWPNTIMLKKRQSYCLARCSKVLRQFENARIIQCLILFCTLFSRPPYFRVRHLNLRVNCSWSKARFLSWALYRFSPFTISMTPRAPRLIASALRSPSATLYLLLALIYLSIVLSLRALKSSHFFNLLSKYSRCSS